MINDDALKKISQMFIGDILGFYSYKSGPQLVDFFNNYYGLEDQYINGFPSRWVYVQDKLKNLEVYNDLESFFNIILNRDYIISDSEISPVDALAKIDEIITEFNRLLAPDKYIITKKDNNYFLVKENTDLILIGSGGFANVYNQKSTGLVLKKLKDEFLSDEGVRSRFKREFNITKSLNELSGIITVYSFDQNYYQYTMEPADITLEDYVLKNSLSNENKNNIIRIILTIMSEVHKRDIIHRDLSPNNIFLIANKIKIADFGLGKDLKSLTSHQTIHTNSIGQYYYCSPEQFMMLKDADKRSDVYSLGRIINFIMTGNPSNSNHSHRNVAEKATNSDSVYRYADASQLLYFFEKSVEYHNDSQKQKEISDKIQNKIYDSDVENYIYDLTSEEMSKELLNGQEKFKKAIIKFMDSNDEQAQHIIQSIEKSFKDVCGRSYEAYDIFASLADDVLRGNYSFTVREIAATILRYIAWDVNRFFAQHLIESLIDDGMEPMLEDVLRSN